MPEPLHEVGIVGVASVHDLDRDGAAESLVDGLVDIGHPAGADALGDPVPATEDHVFHVGAPVSFARRMTNAGYPIDSTAPLC